jgi:hypothetical protein
MPHQKGASGAYQHHLRVSNMGKSAFSVVLCLTLAVSSQAKAMTCDKFLSMGAHADSIAELIRSSFTSSQVDSFESIVRPYIKHIDSEFFGALFSDREKILNSIRDKNRLSLYMDYSLSATRAFCFEHPTSNFEEAAIKQFDHSLYVSAFSSYNIYGN